MRTKMNKETSPAFAIQHGNELESLKEAKLQVVDLYPEVGMTDWEIHLNKTNHFREEYTTQGIKKLEIVTKKNNIND